jgi:hypothetical protein
MSRVQRSTLREIIGGRFERTRLGGITRVDTVLVEIMAHPRSLCEIYGVCASARDTRKYLPEPAAVDKPVRRQAAHGR